MIDYIEKAKAFAMMAHKGQTDKAGEDYFTAHVAVVADGVEPDPLVKAAAYLHDTVEDTGTTIDTIRAEFPQEVAEAVSVPTRKKDMTYAEYIWRVKQNDIAVKVKRADLVSNMDLNRIPYPLTSKDLAREAKYLRAYKMLDGMNFLRERPSPSTWMSSMPMTMSIRLRKVPKTAKYMAFSSTVQCICANRKSNRLLGLSRTRSSVTAY